MRLAIALATSCLGIVALGAVSAFAGGAYQASGVFRVDRDGRVNAALGCPAGGDVCSGVVTLKSVIPIASRRDGGKAIRTLVRGQYGSVPAGGRTTVKLRLRAAARYHVLKERQTKARIVFDPPLAQQEESATVTRLPDRVVLQRR